MQSKSIDCIVYENLKYLMTKKVYKQKIFFSVITKNSNWEILVHEKPIYWGGLPKKGGLEQFADLRGGGGGDLARKRGVVFLRRGG